jgi:hypothetical protein
MTKRVGNWYTIELQGEEFNVLVQKDKDMVTCDPSSILVFDDNFNKVEDYYLWDIIQSILEGMDWKSDIVVGV